MSSNTNVPVPPPPAAKQSASAKRGRGGRGRGGGNARGGPRRPNPSDAPVVATPPPQPVPAAQPPLPVVNVPAPQQAPVVETPAPSQREVILREVLGDAIDALKTGGADDPREGSRPRDFMSAVRKYRVPVIHGSLAETVCNKLNIFTVEKTSTDTNPHGASAAVRQAATVALMSRLFEAGYRSWTSMYSSPRDKNILDKLDVKREVCLMSYRPLITADDVVRDGKDTIKSMIETEVMFAVDLYETPSGPLSGVWISEQIRTFARNILSTNELERSAYINTPRFYWVGRKFEGDYGVCESEAAWIRNAERGSILFRPDVTEQAFEHDPCSWIWGRNSLPLDDDTYLCWSIAKAVGSFHIVVFGIYDSELLPGQRSTVRVNVVEMCETVRVTRPTESGLAGYFAGLAFDLCSYVPPIFGETLTSRLFGTQPALLPSTLVEEYQRESAGRSKTAIALTQAKTFAATRLSDSAHEYGIMCRLFPKYFTRDVDLVGWALLTHNIREKAETAQYISSHYGTDIVLFNEANRVTKTSPPQDPPAWSKTYVFSMGALLLGGAYWVNRRYRRPAPGMLISVQTVLDVIQAVNHEPKLALNDLPMGRFMAIAVSWGLLIAPTWEEMFKKKLGRWGWLFGLFEFAIKIGLHGVHPAIALPALAMHTITWLMPLPQAIAFHGVFNTVMYLGEFVDGHFHTMARSVAASPHHSQMWSEEVREAWLACGRGDFFRLDFNEFLARYHFGPWDGRTSEADPQRGTISFPASSSVLPCSKEPFFTNNRLLCTNMVVRRTFLPQEREDTPSFWQIIATSAPGYVPAHTDEMMLATVRARLLAQPPMDPIVQRAAWHRVRTLHKKYFYYPKGEPIYWEHVVAAWVDHFPSAKRTMYRGLIEALFEGRASWDQYVSRARATNVMLKTNEILFKRDGDVCCLKPRLISNISPEVQCIVGPVIFEVQNRFKKAFSVDIEWRDLLDGWKIGCTYAGASTDEDLTRWRYNVDQGPEKFIAIIVSGDDSLVVIRNFGQTFCFEGDASMYDQSLSRGPLWFAHRAHRKLGMGKDTVKLMRRLATNTFRVPARNKSEVMLIDKAKRPIRDTGGSDTSLGNSTIMLYAWWSVSIYMIRMCNFNTNFVVSSFAELGLEMKVRKLMLDEVTFLKGMWYYTTAGPYWGPLPSRILKMGKSMKNPLTLYPRRTYAEACSLFLSDIAGSYASFLQVPMVRQHIKNFLRRDLVRNYVEPHQVQAALGPKPELDDLAYGQVCKRYGVELYDILEAEELYPTAPFFFASHPIYEKLVAADYA
jgi:hypothetical protein